MTGNIARARALLHGGGRLLPDAQIGIVRFENDAGMRPLTSTLEASARSRIGISPPYLALTETAAALHRPGEHRSRTRAGLRPARRAGQGPPRHAGRVAGQRRVGLGRRGRSVLSPRHGPPPAAPDRVGHRSFPRRPESDPKATAEILVALEAALLGIAR